MDMVVIFLTSKYSLHYDATSGSSTVSYTHLSGTMIPLDDKCEERDLFYLGNYTHVFELENDLLSFQLWERCV